MIKKLNLFFLVQIVKIGFRTYPKLYLLLFISFISIMLEIIAMSMISSISSDKYIIMESFLSTVDKKIMFIIVVGLFIIRFISIFFIENYQVLISRKFQSYLSTEALNHILKIHLFEIEKKEIGFFISMAGDEASRASEILNAVLKIFNFSILFVLYLSMIAYFDFKIVIILCLFFILSLYAVKMVMKKSSILGGISLSKGREATSIFLDGLNGLKTIKSFGIESFVYEKYKSSMYEYQIANYKVFFLSLVNRILPVIFLFILFEFYILIDYTSSNILTTVYLIALFFILMRFLLNLGELLQTVNKIVSDLKATNNIIQFITNDTSIGIDDKKELIINVKLIKFEKICFKYENSKNIFTDLNLEFKTKNSYAIIGKTGSGKSTLIDLMMDFLVPTQGKVMINDTDSKKIDVKSLKEKIIYISQESIIFNDTIRNNLLLDRTYTDEDIYKVLELVELTSMVSSFEQGLNHLLNYRGTNISGGQKQRLNIARAILRNPDVLILDESINALDSVTRINIVKRLLSQYKEKILIFVTHDEDILCLVNNIINLDEIKISKDSTE